ncbi:preprotein translocase subunit SecA [Stieleria varia]|uniref:Protein translocase subunit SecA n=2 Tax=Stieleria varia TaxID=2528005 RepID=A0A5C6B915_9BACT|nr:preprotein translocase subunit SecA [Stieleria varia]TWU08132.1 preprotein translocase subunit SecA [Stieleria varia]
MASSISMLNGLTNHLVTLLRPASHSGLIQATRESWKTLQRQSESQLRESCQRTRDRVRRLGVDDLTAKVDGLALMAEALRRVRGVSMYDVQLHAACVLAQGGIAEMQTGEGKTFSCAPPAFLHALLGRGVHVATTNAYLAERDHELLSPVFRLLGVNASLLPEKAGNEEKRKAYQCDVTYGTGSEFGFDYLRDQLSLRAQTQQKMGQSLLSRLKGDMEPALMQRGLYYSIIDEADNVMLDDAVSPLVLSEAGQGEAADRLVYHAATDAVNHLREGRDYTVTGTKKTHRLTEEGNARVQVLGSDLPVELFRRTWMEYISVALRASQMRRDVDYIVDGQNKVQIVDGSTGRIFEDRTWRDGLHQAVESKEGLEISNEKGTMAQITRQRFGRLYQRLAGTTGTAQGCEREFREVYRLSVHTIPLRTPSQREIWPTRSFESQEAKWAAIAASVADLHATGRPVLVGTNSIRDSKCLAALFQEHGIEYQLLNGIQDADEASIVAAAGRYGAVMIATSLAGRGTDIKLEPEVRSLGGLHVIVAQCNESSRVDRQLVGRCGRQGDPGTAQSFLSAQDELLENHAPWLSEFIKRHTDETGECTVDVSAQIRRIQRLVERNAFARRAAMFRRDVKNSTAN